MSKIQKKQLQQHWLSMMDKAILQKFNVRCETKLNATTRQYETAFEGEPEPAVIVFIAGYQRALADVFIMARV